VANFCNEPAEPNIEQISLAFYKFEVLMIEKSSDVLALA
jgi:hypothetical protein